MRSPKRKLAGTLSLALALFFALTLTAQAAGGGGETGSISVTLQTTGGSTVSGASLQLYRVADLTASGGYTLSEAFGNCGIDLTDPQAENLAEHLWTYAQTQGIAAQGTAVTGSSGRALFSDVNRGLYLVVQSGAVSGYYPMDPFLVTVPMTASDGKGQVYQVEASPKVQVRPHSGGGGGSHDSSTYTSRSVQKVWEDDGTGRPESVEVALLKDGKVDKTVTLNEANHWSYTWTQLNDRYSWTVSEVQVPEGYTARYDTSGTAVTITNTREQVPDSDTDTLTVKKLWSGDEGTNRPDSITVQLWQGNALYRTIILSDGNQWTYTWTGLPKGYDWSVSEESVPAAYTATYTVDGTVVTIQNTYTPDQPDNPDTPQTPGQPDTPGTPDSPGSPGATGRTDTPKLAQTGQLNWPIPVLAGCGVVLFALGWGLVYLRKPKS